VKILEPQKSNRGGLVISSERRGGNKQLLKGSIGNWRDPGLQSNCHGWKSSLFKEVIARRENEDKSQKEMEGGFSRHRSRCGAGPKGGVLRGAV